MNYGQERFIVYGLTFIVGFCAPNLVLRQKIDVRLDKTLDSMVACENLSQGGGDMGEKHCWMGAGHPPRGNGYVRSGRFPRMFLKATLFLVALIIFFHLPDLDTRMSHRRETVEEIFSMLERHRTGLATIAKEELAEVIYEEAVRYNHDPKFIMALIFVESEYFNWAVSDKGAKGLMQIMPYVARAIAKDRCNESTDSSARRRRPTPRCPARRRRRNMPGCDTSACSS